MTVRAKRLLLVASSGGHWAELVRLRSAFRNYDAVYVTTLHGVEAPSGSSPVVSIPDASRSEPWSLLVVAFSLLRLILKHRPDFVISTGAAPGLIALQIGRVLGAKTIWVDSIANAEQLSASGRCAKYVSSLWLTQWPHLKKDYPGLDYYGSVF